MKLERSNGEGGVGGREEKRGGGLVVFGTATM